MSEVVGGEEKRERVPRHIVDAHNQALYHWAQAGVKNALLFHIDAHPDTVSGAPTLETARATDPTLSSCHLNYPYVNTSLTVGNFLVVACHEQVIGPIYWYNPQSPTIKYYGTDTGSRLLPPETDSTDGHIEWKHSREYEGKVIHTPESHKLLPMKALTRLQQDDRPIIIDIDLDAIACTENHDFQNTDKAIAGKLARIGQVIHKIPKERIQMVTIATSQTPTTWVPPEKVLSLLHAVNQMLNDLKI